MVPPNGGAKKDVPLRTHSCNTYKFHRSCGVADKESQTEQFQGSALLLVSSILTLY